MHHCLSIFEVVDHAFTQLGADKQGQATLARLARVCTTFKDVALNRLYCNVESFADLLNCLPRNIWAAPENEFDRQLRLCRAMTESDWSVLISYAERVEKLRFSFQHHETTPGDDVLRVLNQSPTGVLFPKLRRLTLLETYRVDAHLLSFLFCPQISRLDLVGCPSRLFEEVDVPMLCPSVEHLDVSNGIYNVQISHKTMGQVLQRWPLLKHIKCPSLDSEGLKVLASLSKLRSLDITIANHTPWISISSKVEFHSLQSLTFTIDSPEACASALRSLAHNSSGSFTPLVIPELTIASNLLIAQAMTPLTDVTTPLARYIASDKLTSLHLRGSGDTLVADPPFNAYAGLEPLTSFSQLRHLKLEYIHIQLDFRILSIASSWPLLETFWMARMNCAMALSRAMKFLAVWPRLRVFHLPIMVIKDHIEAIAVDMGSYEPHKCIRKLQLRYPSNEGVPDIQQMADFFARLMPGISEVESEHIDQYVFWENVLEEVRNRCRDLDISLPTQT